MARKAVIFARVNPEAKAWVMKKAKKNKKVTANVIIERLILNDKRKNEHRAA